MVAALVVHLVTSFVTPQNAITSRAAGPGPKMANAAIIEKKAAKVVEVKETLDNTALLFKVPIAEITVNQMSSLRSALPDTIKLECVKNTIMRRAMADTNWDVGQSLCDGANYWFFVGEDDLRSSVNVFEDFVKDTGLNAEKHAIVGGVMDGVLYDSKGVKACSKLPTKIELITKVAVGINAVSTKLARSINMLPTKVAKSIKLASETMEEDA